MTPIALTIAGSDPSGGAGIQADLKTFHQRNVYGMSVLTLLTVQNTRSVDAVEPLAPGSWRHVVAKIALHSDYPDLDQLRSRIAAVILAEAIRWLAATGTA